MSDEQSLEVSSPTENHYLGKELDIFAIAHRWKSYAKDQLRPYISGSVLEVGAGKGSFTVSLQDCDHTAWCCVEPDIDLARQIDKKRAEGTIRPHVEFIGGTLSALPSSRTFDTILYLDVLEHIEADRAEVMLAFRRLNHGGRIVVLAPAFSWLYSPFDAAIGHHRRYTRPTLEALRPPGLVTEAAFYLDAPGLLLSLANRSFLRQQQPTTNQIAFWDRMIVPLARRLDPILGHGFGRSVVVIWHRVDSLATVGV